MRWGFVLLISGGGRERRVQSGSTEGRAVLRRLNPTQPQPISLIQTYPPRQCHTPTCGFNICSSLTPLTEPSWELLGPRVRALVDCPAPGQVRIRRDGPAQDRQEAERPPERRDELGPVCGSHPCRLYLWWVGGGDWLGCDWRRVGRRFPRHSARQSRTPDSI